MDDDGITLKLPLAKSLKVLRALGTSTGVLEVLLLTCELTPMQRENLATLIGELRDAGDQLVGLERAE